MVATLPQASTNQSILRDTRLAPYAPGRSEVAELVERFRASLSYKGADKLTNLELQGLAVASLSLGLNPYLSEIWALPGMGLMIGRAGWVKKLDENLTANGITWWDQYLDIRPNEYEQYGIPKNAKLARLCELRRRDQIEAYITALERLRAIFPEMPSDQIIGMVGLPPVIRGVGYIMADEIEPGQSVQKTGRNGSYTQQTGYMSWGERCNKRAFAQACKQTVSLPFNVVAAGDIVDGMIVGDWSEEEKQAIRRQIAEAEAMPDDAPEPTEQPDGDEPAQSTQVFPFPPDKRLCDFESKDWTAFWPFMQRHTGKTSKESNALVHDALQVASAKESSATFSQCLDAVDQYMAAEPEAGS